MDIRITISKETEDLLADAFRYQAEIDDGKGILIPNPESKENYITRITKEILKDKLREHEIIETTDSIYNKEIRL